MTFRFIQNGVSVCCVDRGDVRHRRVVQWYGLGNIPPLIILEPVTEPVTRAEHRRNVGGVFKAANITSPAVEAAAACVVANLNAQSNSVYQLQLVRVLAATQQIVAGIKYNLVVETGMSTCMNNGNAQTLAACPVSSSSLQQYKVANVSV